MSGIYVDFLELENIHYGDRILKLDGSKADQQRRAVPGNHKSGSNGETISK